MLHLDFRVASTKFSGFSCYCLSDLVEKMKGNKFYNKKTVVDGITFASKAEASRYSYLMDLQRKGDISKLYCQVKYLLIPKKKKDDGKMERECCYIADFVYNDINNNIITEDVKGGESLPDYIIKRKLMLMIHGITVKEIRKTK